MLLAGADSDGEEVEKANPAASTTAMAIERILVSLEHMVCKQTQPTTPRQIGDRSISSPSKIVKAM
jgi:hypothetical protein